MSRIIELYTNTIEGKRKFVENIIAPLVQNENHFKDCKYVQEGYEEWIELTSWSTLDKPIKINVTADSLEALIRDFCRNFLKFIEEKY